MKLKKRKMGTIFAAAALLAATILVSGCGKANIGYVNGERIMKESPQIQTIVKEGNEKLAAQQKESEAKLAKDKAGKSDADYQKEAQEEEAKLATVRQQYSEQLKAKVDAAVGDISKAKKLDAVVANEEGDKAVVQGGTDITDDVIQKLK